ncbi:MAG: DNA polymerase III subunit alpha [Hyphomicrobiaceae bacterium]|nr:DNA polymerase III subunit alpha [Hyphomicrobiaceae bacterium]
MNAPIRPQDTNNAKPLNAGRFVHLKVHSAYSLLEGALPISKLAKLAEAHAMPAIGLTDSGNMFGVLEFSDKLAGAGIQPIAGVTLRVDFRDAADTGRGALKGAANEAARPAGPVALLARTEAGYANLAKLNSAAFLKTPDHEPPHVKIEALEERWQGIIALSGGPDGPIDAAIAEGRVEVAKARLQRLKDMYGTALYVEVQRHGTPVEAAVEPTLLALAYELEIPLVATNECYFAKPEDYEAHDALICIAEGRYVTEDDRRRLTREHYFKSADDMIRLFSDLPEAIANTVEIAKLCAYRPRGRKPILPAFVKTAEGASGEDRQAAEAAELKRQAEEGLVKRLEVVPLAPGFTREDYEKRLAYEVGIIAQMKFPGYFLIVADFIKWSKANGIPVGPGRGSGAGSLVAWALTITDLDPLRFGLLFERFLNPERVSMPDFDIDFCQDRRDEVIKYVQQKYGEDRVAQIITHGKLQARAVLRDVGRVLQMPYGQVDKLCKLVPNNPANPVTLREAIDGEPKLQEAGKEDAVVAKLLEVSEKLEGLYRHASTHAAGMVIGDRPLDELVPMYRDPKSNFPITQFNWKLVEAAGLVKFDFLGLKTLTVLQKAVDLIRRGRGVAIDLAQLPIAGDDPKVLAAYELLAKADTVGVFQLESTGMRESLKRLKPDRFEDIIAMVALYRPGPMDNIPTYINRKHGDEPIEYPHELIKPILEETYGVIIYQEQVIQIAQVMGGYTLGQADLLRRAMGKKDKAEMARQQAKFVEGAMKNGVKKDDAVYIFELVDKFAGYGFNKSHAAAYALVSYHTAWLKANYREEFLAASMTLDMANTDKLASFAAEARRSGIAVAQPCVNLSEVEFSVEPPREEGKRGVIRYALAGLKNVGVGAVSTIVSERERNGRFKSLADFAGRFDPKVVNKRALEMLAMSGAFDCLEKSRAKAHGNADVMIANAQRLHADKASGISDMFGMAEGPRLDLREVKAWTPMERLQHEFAGVGFYLSGHPLDQYTSILPKLGVTRYADFEARAGLSATAGRLAAIVVSARERRSQKGNKFAFAMFSDATGQFEAVVFSDTLARCRDLLEPGTPVLVSVEAERDGETVKMRVNGIEALDAAATNVNRGLRIVLDGRLVTASRKPMDEIKALLKPGGKSEVRLSLEVAGVAGVPGGREIEIALPGRYEVGAAQRGELSTIRGVIDVVEV